MTPNPNEPITDPDEINTRSATDVATILVVGAGALVSIAFVLFGVGMEADLPMAEVLLAVGLLGGAGGLPAAFAAYVLIDEWYRIRNE